MRRLSVLPLVIGILFFTGLEVWPAHAATNGGIIVGWAKTDKQGQYRWGSMRIKGTVWLDENVDGIRQPSEPALPGSHLVFTVPKFQRSDYEQYEVTAAYLKPGAEPVRKVHAFYYSHLGCASLIIPPREAGRVKLTVDIRVLSINARYGNVIAPPLNWPLADGHFFKEAAQPSNSRCDAGFAVTNSDGIPFWDTLEKLGIENIGYPISQRFVSEGFITQVFRKATFQWQTSRGIFRVEDYGNPLVVRTQRAVLQWEDDVPWSKAGQVKIMSGGRMGIDGVWLGSVPEDAMIPQSSVFIGVRPP